MDGPCAIDSFMLACQLYKERGTKICSTQITYSTMEYIDLKENGGFGTTMRRTRDDYVIPANYEAYWCCTMREEGLFAVSYTAFGKRKGYCHDLPVGIYQVKGITIRTDAIPNRKHLNYHI